MIDIKRDIPLGAYSTMRLGGAAAYFTEVHSVADVVEASKWAEEHSLPLIMVGSGSNIIWPDEGFGGLVVVNKIMGFELQAEDNENIHLTVGAGEPWDSIVARAVSEGLSGIEELSLIPGTAGATPIQNVGAYGREIAEVLVCVAAYDQVEHKTATIPMVECGFGYRDSRFKTTDKGRFLITGLTLRLSRNKPKPPFYESVQSYFDTHNIHDYTPQVVRDAVIAIRSSKLPDPAIVANCGSFFGNPIVSKDEFTQIQQMYPEVPQWPQSDGQIKISAAWLIEQAGLKNYHDKQTGMATWDKQPLVLVNEHAKSTADLLAFKQKIVEKINQQFSITLTQEPELVTNVS